MRRRRNKVVPVRRPWFMGRLFMAAANNPMLRFSAPGDPGVFPSPGRRLANMLAENERYRAAGLVPPYVFVDFNVKE